jgi:putative transposase
VSLPIPFDGGLRPVKSNTSKTCGKCGCVKEDLKGAKIFKCGECGTVIDRDINGARNIMIRLMSGE